MPSDGWRQYDTTNAAWYFGVWVHIGDRKIVTFAEGDLITVDCPTVETFKAELDHMAEFYGDSPPAFTVIDTELGKVTAIYDLRPDVQDIAVSPSEQPEGQ
jgi:hypothetical protein